MKQARRQRAMWNGPTGGRKEHFSMVAPHIRVVSATIRPRRKRVSKEMLDLAIRNYGTKGHPKAQVSVMYSDKVAGTTSISASRRGKLASVSMTLQLPQVAYSATAVPLKIYVNELLAGIEYVRPSPIPPTMVKPVEGLRRRSPRPLGGPGCLPTIDVWIDPDRDTFFTDETCTVNWSANCADSVGINWDSNSAAETLRIIADARRGIYHDHGSDGVYGLPLEGAEAIAIGGPGSVLVTVYAIGGGVRAEQTIALNFINKPSFDDCDDDRQDCILAMLRHIEPLVHAGITLNEDLDSVDVFADGALDRYEFGTRVEEALERLDRITFLCHNCTDEQMESGECPGGDYNEARPHEVNLQFSNRYYPTDYAVLHELCHMVGFNSDLQPEYSHMDIERMTAEVSGAPFDRSRICTEY